MPTNDKITQLYTDLPISLDPGDIFPVTENTGTTPATGAAKVSQLMFNRYKFSVTVSSNDLIVALKHEDGNAPSADRPLYFKIKDTLRAITAATSITIVDGTNWFAAGSADVGTNVCGYFVYLVWDDNSSITALSISRIPFGKLVSDFSATTTNSKHLYNYANFTTTDDVINIGYFEATLSLTGTGHLWTVPTFTSYNMKAEPTYTSNRLTFTPIWSNFTTTSSTNVCFYTVSDQLIVHVDYVFGASTAISGDPTYPMLFLPAYSYVTGGASAVGLVRMRDDSTATNFAAVAAINATTVFMRAQDVSTYVRQATPSSTVPFTWTTSDVFTVDYRYPLK